MNNNSSNNTIPSIKIYLPLGHGADNIIYHKEKGRTIFNSYDMKIVPPNCYYITMARSGEKCTTHERDTLFSMLENENTENLFDSLTDKNTFKNFKSIFESSLYNIPGIIEKESKIRVNMYVPGQEYVDAKYQLISNLRDLNSIKKSGVYDISDVKGHVKQFYKTSKTTASKKVKQTPGGGGGAGAGLNVFSTNSISIEELLDMYKYSILPTQDYFNNLIHFYRDNSTKLESKKTKKPPKDNAIFIPDDVILKYIKNWPFYDDSFYKTNLYGSDSKLKTYTDMLPDKDAIINMLEILLNPDTKHVEFIRNVFYLDELLNVLKFEPEDLEIKYNEWINKFQQRFTRGYVLQSFLFDVFPGAYINMACRVTSSKVNIPESIKTRRRALSNNMRKIYENNNTNYTRKNRRKGGRRTRTK